MESPASFEFFRALPAAPVSDGVLASLQAFETSLFLISLSRFPHALTLCTSAIEGAIKASPKGDPAAKNLRDTIASARCAAPRLGAFQQEDLDSLRRKRNEIVHKGFSPRDDNVCAYLLLNTGIAFLDSCYRELHDFDFMAGLLPEIAEQIQLALRVYSRCRPERIPQGKEPEEDVSYCFLAFARFVRSSFKDSFSSSSDLKAAQYAEEIGVKFGYTEDQCNRLERQMACPWRFDCPICREYKTAVTDLDGEVLEDGVVRPVCLVCPSCGLVVLKEHSFLAEELLSGTVAKERAAILKDYGFPDKPAELDA